MEYSYSALIQVIVFSIFSAIVAIRITRQHMLNKNEAALDKAHKDGYDLGYATRTKAEIVLNREIAQQNGSYLVDKNCMYFPNKWADPVFFIGKDIEIYGAYGDAVMLIGTNVFTGEEVLAFANSVFEATEPMIEAILKLDPFERWNLVRRDSRLGKNHLWKKTNPNATYLFEDELREKLRSVGFLPN